MKYSIRNIILIFMITLVGCSKHQKTNTEINIIFRYDDTSVYTSNDVESKILTIFKEQNVSLSFAVIPYRCEGNPIDTSKQNTLKLNSKKINLLMPYVKDGTLDIVLHGYSHQTSSQTLWSEFKDVPYQEQLDKLKKGKDFFEKVFPQSIMSFVPPYNTYDENTIKALEVLHFKTISADLNAPQPSNSKLHFISNTITIDKIQEIIKKAKASRGLHNIVVMFHEYNFSNIKIKNVDKPEITFVKLKELLVTLKKDKDIHIFSLSQITQKLEEKSK